MNYFSASHPEISAWCGQSDLEVTPHYLPLHSVKLRGVNSYTIYFREHRLWSTLYMYIKVAVTVHI